MCFKNLWESTYFWDQKCVRSNKCRRQRVWAQQKLRVVKLVLFATVSVCLTKPNFLCLSKEDALYAVVDLFQVDLVITGQKDLREIREHNENQTEFRVARETGKPDNCETLITVKHYLWHNFYQIRELTRQQ